MNASFHGDLNPFKDSSTLSTRSSLLDSLSTAIILDLSLMKQLLNTNFDLQDQYWKTNRQSIMEVEPWNTLLMFPKSLESSNSLKHKTTQAK